MFQFQCHKKYCQSRNKSWQTFANQTLSWYFKSIYKLFEAFAKSFTAPFFRRSKFFTFFTNLVSPPAELSSKFCFFALYFSQHFRTSCLTADTSTNRKFIYLQNTFVHSHFQKLLVRQQFWGLLFLALLGDADLF